MALDQFTQLLYQVLAWFDRFMAWVTKSFNEFTAWIGSPVVSFVAALVIICVVAIIIGGLGRMLWGAAIAIIGISVILALFGGWP